MPDTSVENLKFTGAKLTAAVRSSEEMDVSMECHKKGWRRREISRRVRMELGTWLSVARKSSLLMPQKERCGRCLQRSTGEQAGPGGGAGTPEADADLAEHFVGESADEILPIPTSLCGLGLRWGWRRGRSGSSNGFGTGRLCCLSRHDIQSGLCV